MAAAVKETSRMGRTRGRGNGVESLGMVPGGQICYQYDAILKGRVKGFYPGGTEDIRVDALQQEQCMAPLRTGWHRWDREVEMTTQASPS